MRTTTITLLALAFLGGPAFAQSQPASQAPAEAKTYHYWLHPKLGMVKVDKKTHAMLVGRPAQQQTSTPGTACSS
ncbi:hypothetical protein JJ685_08725 [Ramlibacter monticola]|uniref:Uncharacterized protein n=1 Tax=Ramlibacter monticola TaxID=1926872 RepID=A0A936YXC1_9BURK|nr:hypothetical protein [Ramlibacter monticola]MBL0391220.1 hypothetical protein [Ramlibacter monticola]